MARGLKDLWDSRSIRDERTRGFCLSDQCAGVYYLLPRQQRVLLSISLSMYWFRFLWLVPDVTARRKLTTLTLYLWLRPSQICQCRDGQRRGCCVVVSWASKRGIKQELRSALLIRFLSLFKHCTQTHISMSHRLQRTSTPPPSPVCHFWIDPVKDFTTTTIHKSSLVSQEGKYVAADHRPWPGTKLNIHPPNDGADAGVSAWPL